LRKNAATVQRTCMRDRIRDILVARILDGTYPAGMQLKELSLAREFSVSQAPVREALRELEASSLVTCERFRGTRVRGLDYQEMRESYELRGTLEARAVELAMPCPPPVLESLAATLEEMKAGVARNDHEHYVDEALNFHRVLVEASGNRMFLRTWESFHWDVRARIVLRRIVEAGGAFAPLLDMHEELLKQMQANNVSGAIAAIRAVFEHLGSFFQQSDAV
jgi:DNA-binding GntR family transcriptional regulator